jgi:hypothetical protein
MVGKHAKKAVKDIVDGKWLTYIKYILLTS